MSEEALQAAVTLYQNALTDEERKELHRAMEAFDSIDNPDLQSGFSEDVALGVSIAFAAVDKYGTPATVSAINLSTIMGLVYGMAIGWRGEMPGSAFKTLVNYLGFYTSDLEAENAKLQHNMLEKLGRQLPDNWYPIDSATELKRAIIDCYSGKGAERLGEILWAMPLTRWLLGTRSEYESAGKDKAHVYLFDRLVAGTDGNYAERLQEAIISLRQAVGDDDSEQELIKKTLDEAIGIQQMSNYANTLAVRQNRHRGRSTTFRR